MKPKDIHKITESEWKLLQWVRSLLGTDKKCSVCNGTNHLICNTCGSSDCSVDTEER